MWVVVLLKVGLVRIRAIGSMWLGVMFVGGLLRMLTMQFMMLCFEKGMSIAVFMAVAVVRLLGMRQLQVVLTVWAGTLSVMSVQSMGCCFPRPTPSGPAVGILCS